MTADTCATEIPGLVAAAIYLRPARRGRVIAALVELGIFVREFPGPVGRAPAQLPADADVLVLFVDDERAQRELVRDAVEAAQVVIAVLPDGADSGPLSAAGAFAVITDGIDYGRVRRTLSDAGQVARARRSEDAPRRPSVSTTIFGGLEFRPDEPWLARDGALAGLSPTEHGVLRALVTARGAVVPKATLQRQLTNSAVIPSDGYLKTVVLRLRRKAEGLGGDPGRLCAVRGAGYVLRN